jgi:hypothetical protein
MPDVVHVSANAVIAIPGLEFLPLLGRSRTRPSSQVAERIRCPAGRPTGRGQNLRCAYERGREQYPVKKGHG